MNCPPPFSVYKSKLGIDILINRKQQNQNHTYIIYRKERIKMITKHVTNTEKLRRKIKSPVFSIKIKFCPLWTRK